MLSISTKHSAFSQCEIFYAGTLEVVAKQGMTNKLHYKRASIIELNKVAKHPKIPRINKEACFMAIVGKATKDRETL